jgi:hypothetical protein
MSYIYKNACGADWLTGAVILLVDALLNKKCPCNADIYFRRRALQGPVVLCLFKRVSTRLVYKKNENAT